MTRAKSLTWPRSPAGAKVLDLETPLEHVHPANVEILQVKIRKLKAKGPWTVLFPSPDTGDESLQRKEWEAEHVFCFHGLVPRTWR
jgi:hypothetical protein